ncbi:hypothetical protein J2S49_000379 [Arcanobacterium wilhelmae]|uniref:DUF4439 domain-containing protein n=1 Tax=Arcanobacterium wilhelmae TaxID=1803177 RepID=A0ABT9N9C1_9ACTO|nr:hypothetical protein [Arcanobacterium wilhelmae]MDP9800303.1 hypothetical protein [Arcanobacterium wilhelmae]WFN89741.1 hypothetical protein P8A24_05905 [Arcanobacterium wilhelmae]
MGSRIRFVGALVVALALFALVMVVMGTRLDNQQLDPPPASDGEKARQELALTAHALTSSKTAGADAREWETVLGGVWRAWPAGTEPSGHANPSPVVPTGSEKQLLDDVVKLAASFTPDREIGMSIAFSAASHLASTPSTPDVGELARLAASADAVADIDAARQWLTVWTARTRGEGEDAKRALTATLNDIVQGAIELGAKDTRTTYEPIAKKIPDDAYQLLYSRLVQMAKGAHTKGAQALLALASQMQAVPGAPTPGPLPGLTRK